MNYEFESDPNPFANPRGANDFTTHSTTTNSNPFQEPTPPSYPYALPSQSQALSSTPDVVLFPKPAATTIPFHEGRTPDVPPQGNVFVAPPPSSDHPPASIPNQSQIPLMTTSTDPKGAPSMCSFEYYQAFFDVDTMDVLHRMKSTVFLHQPPDFMGHKGYHYFGRIEDQSEVATLEEGGSPATNSSSHKKSGDLYGPFWIVTTLWIALAIVGNILDKVHFERNKTDANATWSYDFTKAVVASAVCYSYAVFIPLSFWGIAYCKNVHISLLDCVCIYGYSFDMFILACILCVIPNDVVQIVTCFVCGAFSVAYILMNMWAVMKQGFNQAWFIGILASILLTHVALTLLFKFYFFVF